MKLSDPYPFTYSCRGNIIVILLISVFVTGFLIVFEPFGLQGVREDYKIMVFGGYGLVNLLILSFNLLVLPRILPGLFNERRWSVLYQVLFLVWIVFTIGLGNFVYSKIMFGFPANGVRGILLFQFYTLVIGIFPIILITITNYNRLLKRNMARAAEMKLAFSSGEDRGIKSGSMIAITSASKNEDISINPQNFLFAGSEGNYVQFVWKNEGDIEKTLIRTTLTRAEEDLRSVSPPVVRVHRSFLVNISHISDVKGNAQGLVLQLKDSDLSVPVSRNYIPSFKALFNR